MLDTKNPPFALLT